MSASVHLRGMTWNHSRGYDPMVACSALWRERTGVDVQWDRRSLQDFESYPVEELAKAYDLIVIDHPHVGEITAQNCLVPLDLAHRSETIAEIAAGDIGGSFESYRWNRRLWALPIDAAAQVQAWRPDLLDAPLTRFDDVLALAGQGRVLLPMRPPHSLMTFFTLAANLGTSCALGETGELISLDAGCRVYDMISALMGFVAGDCYQMDPISVFEEVSASASSHACIPFTYGYISYGLDGFRPNRLEFSDIPAAGPDGPLGSTLGGTGIAVSAFSRHIAEATDFAFWIANGEVQRGPFAIAGGQPGHAAAWEDDAVNQAAHGFYRNTRQTMNGAWTRPRHAGYMAFQSRGSDRLNAGLQAQEPAPVVIAELNRMFAESFK